GPDTPEVKKFESFLKFIRKFDDWIKAAQDLGKWTGEYKSLFDAFNKASGPNAAELDGITTALKSGLTAMIDKLFKPESNFALLMGGEKAFASLVRGLLDAYQAEYPDDSLTNLMSDYFDYVIEKVADFTAIEHNRIYVPTNANFL